MLDVAGGGGHPAGVNVMIMAALVALLNTAGLVCAVVGAVTGRFSWPQTTAAVVCALLVPLGGLVGVVLLLGRARRPARP